MPQSTDGTPLPADADLLLAVKGDRTALQRLLLKHHSRLRTHISRRLPKGADALITVDDVLQETYIDVFRSIRSFEARGPDSFFLWVRTIAHHRLLDAIKAHRTLKRGAGPNMKPAYQGSFLVLLEAVATREKSPRSVIIGRESIGAVQVAMAGLTSDQRTAVKMLFLEERTVEEVAQSFGRTTGSIYMLVQRALNKLRDVLESSSN